VAFGLLSHSFGVTLYFQYDQYDQY
jgi:hypothetical protein